MDLNYSTRNIFPVPIHIFDVNGFDGVKNDLIDYAYNLKKKMKVYQFQIMVVGNHQDLGL